MTQDVNWLAVERDYCAGVFPLDAICARHGITEAELKKYVKERKLRREDFLQDNRRYLAVIDPDDVRETVITGAQLEEIFTPSELEKAALITATSMVELHRSEFANARKHLNGFAQWISASKDNMRVPHPEASLQEHGVSAKIQNMMLNSYSAYVGSLMKIIQLERQTYNLDAVQSEKEVDTAAEQQNVLLLALKEELNTLMEAKSAYAGDDKTVYASEPILVEEKKDG